MVRLSDKELQILRFIRRSRHKTTVGEISRALNYSPSEVQTFLDAMVHRQLLNIAPGNTPSENSYYTNPDKREDIFSLIG